MLVRAELPGADAARDVEVTVDGDQPTIRAVPTDEHHDESGVARCSEFRYGEFVRSVRQ